MKVCVIGDIHGTNKFLDCYNNILKNDNDCEKIIVCGDHFDPYEGITYSDMLERYNKFINSCRNDDRIVSLFGNHDLSSYVIRGDYTNRTAMTAAAHGRISDAIKSNLDSSYLAYVIGNYIFSHAGVSSVWLQDIGKDYADRILNNYKGWTSSELSDVVSFYNDDYSFYGNNEHQGCTWIRPEALIKFAIDNYHQVIGHSQVREICRASLNNGMDLWMTDNARKSEYLTLNI